MTRAGERPEERDVAASTMHLTQRADGAFARRSARPNGPLTPFLVGTLIGALAGAIVGTLLSDRTRALLLGLIQLTGRELSEAEREQLRFELLLQ